VILRLISFQVRDLRDVCKGNDEFFDFKVRCWGMSAIYAIHYNTVDNVGLTIETIAI
jgi:hypothetical protein